MQNVPINIGIIGVGHLGQHHVKHYKKLQDVNVVGIYDTDKGRGYEIANQYDTSAYNNVPDLINNVEAVSIVTPTSSHGEIAELCIKNNKHVFIEKPITSTLEEADHLLKLAKEKSIIMQIGHIERLNPALLALKDYPIKPKFIEIQRLAPYTTRGTDVPVVLDKMIHDIDILLSLVKSNVTTIQATGLSILTNSLDVAHARIRFKNDTVASIMSSRIAQVESRKVKIFQKDLYTTIDMLEGLTEVYRIISKNDRTPHTIKSANFSHGNIKKLISYEKPAIVKKDALYMELKNFIQSIKGNATPIVTGEEGRDALAVALKIQQMIIQDIN